MASLRLCPSFNTIIFTIVTEFYHHFYPSFHLEYTMCSHTFRTLLKVRLTVKVAPTPPHPTPLMVSISWFPLRSAPSALTVSKCENVDPFKHWNLPVCHAKHISSHFRWSQKCIFHALMAHHDKKRPFYVGCAQITFDQSPSVIWTSRRSFQAPILPFCVFEFSTSNKPTSILTHPTPLQPSKGAMPK